MPKFQPLLQEAIGNRHLTGTLDMSLVGEVSIPFKLWFTYSAVEHFLCSLNIDTSLAWLSEQVDPSWTRSAC